MLSVGSRGDARKGLGLGGLHGASEEMEENELEEGEACSIREDDANINPDVDLSYIDEKIQDILGHFQKDFEGGVSAENLGAKFGGYGSFLPAYQRSPSIWPHPRSPQRVPNHNASCSPCNAPAEAAVGTSASVPLKNSTVLKVPPMDGTKKNGTCISIPTLREPTPHYDSANTGSRSNDQNVLKLRIKVGPDNALPRPNAAIYSDMGLEYSPSLSPEDSPGTSGGSSPESRDTTDESPMTIFQIMTCFPILDGYVLSPLPDSLLQMMENERPCLRDSKLTIHKSGLETRDVLLCDSSSSRDVKPSLGKKAKSAERNVKSSDTKNKQELPNRGHPRAILSVAKGDRSEASSADPVTNEASKVLKQPGKLDSQNGQHHSSMRHPTPNGPDAPSPARRDSSHSAATVALKEARDLKHSANRLKNEGLEHESTGLYFQAALKFLHVAFLLENSGAESGKHGETTQSMAMYSDTARLCEWPMGHKLFGLTMVALGLPLPLEFRKGLPL
ncbi:hypothetical protein Taro_003855 [Colocasia esculenta]|uniref:CWZF3/5/7 THD domain-containing protein n=1 Tax=Colocasia esculenta TaxID=4460 RepID=A0A843TT69_COLES|nr:hypothetical protein [Colocasia esculenta]